MEKIFCVFCFILLFLKIHQKSGDASCPDAIISKLLNVKFMHSQWSLLSPHPPFAFFNLIFFLVFRRDTETLRHIDGIIVYFRLYVWQYLSGKKYGLAVLRIVWSLSITASESQWDFLWWTPLKNYLSWIWNK